MPNKKKYSDSEYKKFLKQSFNHDWGVSDSQLLNYCFSNSGFSSKVASYGYNRSWVENTMIPYIKNQMGNHAHVLFLLIIVCEGCNTSLDWINYTYSSGSGYTDLVNSVAHIKQVYTSKYPVASSDPYGGIPTMPNVNECQNFYNSLSAKTVGRYYMPSTLAGNACVWANSWSQGYYFGNPYDTIIDAIKACGGDPFGSSSSTTKDPEHDPTEDDKTDNDFDDIDTEKIGEILQQGGEMAMEVLRKIFPKAVYINNSKFSVLGITFRRYKSWLYIKYPWDDPELWQSITDSDYGDLEDLINGGLFKGDEDDDKEDDEEVENKQKEKTWYKKMVEQLDKIRNKSFYYANVRPQPSLTSVNYADCSGFVGWIARTAFSKLWSQGYINTGLQLSFFKSKGWVVWSGNQTQMKNYLSKVRAGDFIIMGTTPECGAGLYSHVAWVETPQKVWSMEAQGLLCKPLSTYINNWWSYKPYMNVCRPKE